MKMLLGVVLCVFPFFVLANSHTATIVARKGDVKVLIEPLKASGNRAKEVLYESKFYTFHVAKIGMKVQPGEIVQTGPKGKAKLIFANGDQTTLGRGSSYRLLIKKAGKNAKNKDDKSLINLFYGKMRSVISKKGPRRRLKVKTPTAVAGVRGTDFYVRQRPKKTAISVLRGKVKMRAAGKKTKAQTIKTGFSAEVEESKSGSVELVSEQTSKVQLLGIQSVSTLKRDEKKLDAQVKKEIQMLESSATENVLEDIKEYNPEMYKMLKGGKITNVDELNTVVVSKLYKDAPKANKKLKPSLEDIENLQSDVYKKYFDQ